MLKAKNLSRTPMRCADLSARRGVDADQSFPGAARSAFSRAERSSDRDEQFLALILKLYKHATIQTIMKLAYLIDYLAFEKADMRISGFAYKLYSFGPFDVSAFGFLENLISTQVVRSHLNYTRNGLEYVSYVFNDVITDLKFKNDYVPDINLGEFYLALDILYELFYYDEKRLSRMIYQSRPVRILGITGPGEPCGHVLEISPPTAEI